MHFKIYNDSETFGSEVISEFCKTLPCKHRIALYMLGDEGVVIYYGIVE